MMIFKKAIPRRTFLRGVGASLALPMLDAMIPALAASSAITGQAMSNVLARMMLAKYLNIVSFRVSHIP